MPLHFVSPRAVRLLASLALAGALVACAQQGAGRFAGGAGQGDYAPPGPPGDPWRPYIKEAAQRFSIPEEWIRAVMRQESGGHQYRNGEPIVSSAGAMGLMQVMPGTYETLRQRYGLGDDPYSPHDNILAGAAYIREMYDRYGSPGFLAAYNAGPNRLDDYMATGNPLPDETVNYVAAIAPRLGASVPASGPLSSYTSYAAAEPAPEPAPPPPPLQNAAWQPPALTNSAYAAELPPPVPVGAALPAPPIQLASAAAGPAPVAAGDWAVQVGAFSSPDLAQVMAGRAQRLVPEPGRLSIGPTVTAAGMTLYRARLTGFSEDLADSACDAIRQQGTDCLVVPPGG